MEVAKVPTTYIPGLDRLPDKIHWRGPVSTLTEESIRSEVQHGLFMSTFRKSCGGGYYKNIGTFDTEPTSLPRDEWCTIWMYQHISTRHNVIFRDVKPNFTVLLSVETQFPEQCLIARTIGGTVIVSKRCNFEEEIKAKVIYDLAKSQLVQDGLVTRAQRLSMVINDKVVTSFWEVVKVGVKFRRQARRMNSFKIVKGQQPITKYFKRK
jgi:hypothetical protein